MRRRAFFLIPLVLAVLLSKPATGQDQPAANVWTKLDKAVIEGRRWDIPVGYSLAKGGFMNSLRFDFNRQSASTQNLYAFSRDIAGQAGILGASTDPFDWGTPNLSFSKLTSLRDINPSMRVDRTLTVGDSVIKTVGKQTFRFGGDYRVIRFDSRTDPNARGNFVFTGLYTGLDFADFLLGLPQQSTVQYGAGQETFQGRSWDLFAQDDWRIRDNLTLNLGLRYEYYSPFAEAYDRLVTLDVNSDFTAAVPVQAGQVGPFTGAFPATIVQPDRNNFAPRIGIAWRPKPGTVVRTGYGINYSAGVYQTIVQQLSAQPPFAFTNTVLATPDAPVLINEAAGLPTRIHPSCVCVTPVLSNPVAAKW